MQGVGPAEKKREVKEFVMKKYMLMLAIALIASPAMAAVEIIAVDADADGPGLVANISYNVPAGTEPNKVAAFALDITVDAGTIVAIGDFHTGVSVEGNDGYGIFPASFYEYIDVDGNGNVADWTGAGNYSPAALVGDKGALGGIGTAGVTVELGALYKGEANAPADAGLLLSVTCSEACNLSIVLNGIRGDVVLEGAGSPSSVDLTQATGVGVGGTDECLAPDAPGYADWVAFGKPECWCYLTQCHGDADGLKEGSPITGYKRVFIADLDALIAAYNVKEAPKGPGILSIPNGICADFMHNAEGSPITGYKRVFISDLDKLIENYNVKEAPKGPGVPKDCVGATIDPDTL